MPENILHKEFASIVEDTVVERNSVKAKIKP